MKRFLSLVLCLVMVLSLAACGGNGGSADGDGVKGHLVIYTSEPQDLVTEMIEDFCSKNPGVTYELFRSGTGDVKTKLSTELENGSTPANIVWFADLAYMYQLDDKGLIYHYSPEAAADLPAEYKYRNGMGHEVRGVYEVIAYNTLAIDEANAPKDWFDITGAEYNGAVALANPSYSGAAMTTLSAHIENPDVVGWDWYNALADNDAKMETSNGTLSTKVASGEYKSVVVCDYLPRNAKAEGSPVDYVYPASGSVLINTPLCILGSEDDANIEAAKAFIDYMFEVETQKLFVQQGYVPMNSAACEGTDMPTYDQIKVLPATAEFMDKNTSDMQAQFAKTFGE